MMIPLGRDGSWRPFALRLISVRPAPRSNRLIHRQPRLVVLLRPEGKPIERSLGLRPLEKAGQSFKCPQMPWGAPPDHHKNIDSVCFDANIVPFFCQVGEGIGGYWVGNRYCSGWRIIAKAVICLAGIVADCFLGQAPKSELDCSAMVVGAFAEGF